jgi:hypothetical protein
MFSVLLLFSFQNMRQKLRTYQCFSVYRKIELIQSKVGISLTAVITILGSLFMSLGLTGIALSHTFFLGHTNIKTLNVRNRLNTLLFAWML